MKRVLFLCAFFFMVVTGLRSQQSTPKLKLEGPDKEQSQEKPPAQKLKIYISADMEGIGGVSTWEIQAGSSGREYEKFRHLMTREVDAAIVGAQKAGAVEVLVSDSHGDGQNIDLEELAPGARLIRAWPRPLGMMQGIDNSFDAVLFIGYHASEGEASAILSHTMSHRRVFEIKLNGLPVSEAAFNAAIAGEFGVPVVFLSGDQTICADAQKLLGPIETVVVKEATGFYSATMLGVRETRTRIYEAVARAVARRAEIKPYKLQHPVKMEITFKNVVDAEIVSLLPGVERPRGNAVLITAKDMIEASKFLEAIMDMNTFKD